MRSLQSRFLVGGGIWAIATTLIGTFTLLAIFDEIAKKHFDRNLAESHNEIVRNLSIEPDPSLLETRLADPAYKRPFSGQYWQVQMVDESTTRSESLFDFVIDTPKADRNLHPFEVNGPMSDIRGLIQLVTLPNGQKFSVTVAASKLALLEQRSQMRQGLAIVLGIIGLAGLTGIAMGTTFLLRPLRKIQESVATQWDDPKGLKPEEFPTEVAPLVADIADLVERNHKIIQRGKRHTADFAHALKTPSAALRNELYILKNAGIEIENAAAALDRIDQQITRSLAAIRAKSNAEADFYDTNIAASLERMKRLFSSILANKDIGIEFGTVPEIIVDMDSQDLEEIVGNIIDNATKWAKSNIKVSVNHLRSLVYVVVEDDGPGVEIDAIEKILSPGTRMDSQVKGAGLGLAITKDILEAYGGQLKIDKSPNFSGLRVSIGVPVASSK